MGFYLEDYLFRVYLLEIEPHGSQKGVVLVIVTVKGGGWVVFLGLVIWG